MYKTVKSIKKLKFPLYPLPNNNWYQQDGVVFIDNQVIDDLNKPGESIGLRRLQSGRDELFKLRNPVFTIKDLITFKHLNFISSCGKPFTYEKTGFQQLKYHLIEKFDMRGTFTFVWLKGITVPLELARPPSNPNEVDWARVLYYGDFPWMIYDFSKYRGKNSRIKV